jgi:hypothetical protein
LLHLAWILPLLLLIVFLSSPRFRGDIAETRVRRLLSAGLQRNRYTVFDRVLLPTGGGTIEVDHVVVSKLGIFVIESHYARGWVSGSEVQDRWKQQSLLGLSRFDNPVHRNRLQVEALQRCTGFPAAAFHPLVVLVGHRGFKQSPPPNVLPAGALLPWIRKQTQQVLSPEQADHAIRAIHEARLETARGWLRRPLNLVRLLLLLALLAGCWLVFHDDLDRWFEAVQLRQEQRSQPEQFHADGRRKTEQELWEDSLACAWSEDTGRCSCYEPSGTRADRTPARCRELAERGSVLRQ